MKMESPTQIIFANLEAMKAHAFPWGLLLCVLLGFANPLNGEDGHKIQGENFEGVIAVPAMMSDFSHCEGSILGTGIWTPSPELVREAEGKLPKAVDVKATPPKIVASYYVPAFYSPKGGAPVGSPGHQRLESNLPDSIEQNNFLYDVRPILSEYKRQYLGVTYQGKRYLLIDFVHAACFSDDPYIKKNWGHRWIATLDGGDLFWDVLYDPVSGTFSEWQCNGSA
jgi:hypothetical protein